MVIDFHTHTFPDKIAAAATAKLSRDANIPLHSDGRVSTLMEDMKRSGVDYSVLLPVATTPSQYHTINRVAYEVNEKTAETGILSFGSLHPDNENYKEILRDLAAHKVKGVKLHPLFVGTAIDDLRVMRIIDSACEFGLYTIVHGGYDANYPGNDQAHPVRIKRVLDQIHPDKLILAHMGAWGAWDEVEDLLLDYPIYIDTSTTIGTDYLEIGYPDEIKWLPEQAPLSISQFERMIRKLGADRVLMGSDSPWTDQANTVCNIRKTNLTQEEKELILGGNAARILGLDQAPRH